MPLFEYECKKCSQHQELLVSYDEREDQLCHFCGAALEAPSFSKTSPPKFKGSGFYETDYKKKS